MEHHLQTGQMDGLTLTQKTLTIQQQLQHLAQTLQQTQQLVVMFYYKIKFMSLMVLH
jgi:hypothetical protein